MWGSGWRSLRPTGGRWFDLTLQAHQAIHPSGVVDIIFGEILRSTNVHGKTYDHSFYDSALSRNIDSVRMWNNICRASEI
ncbi:hypothetical protein KIN20_006150 [Parelaphostrongylus tenuis]|uniref:Uncharacterized protein n=1 Tax=Parelaphostrongylus tenuis TaxID=148309 RepID=A0AAD5M190_PARTN|nr:hypothetical protein KIN20_006150 [Parelaphostrongylus tenuis]